MTVLVFTNLQTLHSSTKIIKRLMESNKSLKRKHLAEELAAKNREQAAHYKRLGREQKKRRRDRKKNQDVSKQRIVSEASSGEKQLKEDLAHIAQPMTQLTQVNPISRQ